MTQPEALRLADLLLSENAMDCLEHSDNAAAELRRLYEESQALRQTLAQPEQEPVAWMHKNGNRVEGFFTPDDDEDCEHCDHCIPLYTAPPKREWQGLTREDKAWAEMLNEPYGISEKAYLYLEAKLKEKNT